MGTAPAAVPAMAAASSGLANDEAGPTTTSLPRVTIQFCTQCKWMLRAAYYAQELLSTFSTALGEVALQPSTGGTFVVGIVYTPPPAPQRSPAPTTQGASESTAGVSSDPPLDVQTETPSTREPVRIQHKVLWDRKVDGGFPETKELKRRVRDVIEPERNLGHVDREYPKGSAATAAASKEADATKVKGEEVDGRDGDTTKVLASGGGQGKEECEDCK